MRVTPSIDIDSVAKLTSSTANDYYDPAAYNAGTTYAFGAIIKVVADFKIYESLAAGNVGNTPSTNPLWWRPIAPTELAWNSGTTYAKGDTVSANRRIYESMQPANTNNPVPVLPETLTDWWQDVGPTMKWAMFDVDSNTQTVVDSPLTVTFKPGQRVNTIGFVGCGVNKIEVSATSVFGGGTVYPLTEIDMNTRVVADGYDYAFEPFSTRSAAVLFDLPPYSDIIITAVLTSSVGNAKCGGIIVGTYIYLGGTQYGATADAKNFSTAERTKYGKATLVPRRSVPLIDVKLKVKSYRVNKVKAARTLLNAKTALWTWIDESQSDWFDLGVIVGFYNKFVISPVVNEQADVTLGIEEI